MEDLANLVQLGDSEVSTHCKRYASGKFKAPSCAFRVTTLSEGLRGVQPDGENLPRVTCVTGRLSALMEATAGATLVCNYRFIHLQTNKLPITYKPK